MTSAAAAAAAVVVVENKHRTIIGGGGGGSTRLSAIESGLRTARNTAHRVVVREDAHTALMDRLDRMQREIEQLRVVWIIAEEALFDESGPPSGLVVTRSVDDNNGGGGSDAAILRVQISKAPRGRKYSPSHRHAAGESGLGPAPQFVASAAAAAAAAAVAVANRASNLRGQTCDIIIVDEGAFANPEIMPSVIGPLLEKMGALLIVISSPGDTGEDLVSFLMSQRDGGTNTGPHVFARWSMQFICKVCLMHPERMKNCRHLRRLIPPHKDLSTWQKFDFMYRIRPDAMYTELRGVNFARVRGPLGACIDDLYGGPEEIPRWRPTPGHCVRRIVVAVDPNWSGEGSEMGICSAAHYPGKRKRGLEYSVNLVKIVGVDAQLTCPEEARALLLSHLTLLTRKYQTPRILVIFERNLVSVPQYIAGAVRAMPNVDFFQTTDAIKDFGYLKTRLGFEDALSATQNALGQHAVQFAADMVCAGPARATNTLAKFREQAIRYTLDSKRNPDFPVKRPAGMYDLVEAFIINVGVVREIVHHVYDGMSAESVFNN